MAPATLNKKKVEQAEDVGLLKPVSFAEADTGCKDECDDTFSPVLRYSILGLICLLAFLIRLIFGFTIVWILDLILMILSKHILRLL